MDESVFGSPSGPGAPRPEWPGRPSQPTYDFAYRTSVEETAPIPMYSTGAPAPSEGSPWLLRILAGSLVVALGGAGFFGYTSFTTRADLDRTHTQLARSQVELKTTRSILSTTQSQLAAQTKLADDARAEEIRLNECIIALSSLGIDVLTYGQAGVLLDHDIDAACDKVESAAGTS